MASSSSSSTGGHSSGPQSAPAAPLPRSALVGLLLFSLLVLAAGGFVYAQTRSPAVPELPSLGQAPAFTLTDTQGQPFQSSRLAGKLWVANFIFTRCPTICPRFTEKMAEVERKTRALGPAVHFVSLTVDPEHDTPERLAMYAQRYEANPERWSFLTGSRQALEDLILRGLHIFMEKGGEGADDIMSIGHGGHFVLVDEKGTLRGYYDSADTDATSRLVADLKQLSAARSR